MFNGVPDSSIGTDTAVSNHRDYAARLFLTPFQPDEKSLLKGLGVGFAASGGNTDGEALPSFKTFGQNSFLHVRLGRDAGRAQNATGAASLLLPGTRSAC